MGFKSIGSRFSGSQWSLKPQDLAIAFKLFLLSARWPGYLVLAQDMHLSTREAQFCVSRLTQSRLLADVDGALSVNMPAFKPFLFHGAPHFFPAIFCDATAGVPTSFGAPMLLHGSPAPEDHPPVWPDDSGPSYGVALLPLYPVVVHAAGKDPLLYELLALFDALRSGQAALSGVARQLLDERLSAAS